MSNDYSRSSEDAHLRHEVHGAAPAAVKSGRPVRILMLLENESYPDDSRVALEANTLNRAGYDVTVICPTGQCRKKHEIVNGVRVYRYPQPWEIRGFVGYVLEYAYSTAVTFVISLFVLLRHGFDVVHVHAPPDLYGLLGAFYKLLRKRFVLDQHDLSPELYQAQKTGDGNRSVHRALLWFERFACRWADEVIVTNETQRSVQLTRCGVHPERCHVVRNGPDENFLAPVDPIQDLRESGKTVIGYVGMIGVQDGLDCLLRTLVHLRDDFGREDFLAVIVGSGPALADIQTLSEKKNLQDQVRFTGYLTGEELLRHIASFDICVTPDPSNPYNDSCTTIKTMEYMAMGKPVVAFDLPENRHTAADAALYASGNAERELAAKIVQLMGDVKLRNALGQRGRQRIVQQFLWEIQAERLLNVYEQVLSHAARLHDRRPRRSPHLGRQTIADEVTLSS